MCRLQWFWSEFQTIRARLPRFVVDMLMVISATGFLKTEVFAQEPAIKVDLELVLAVDVSHSMDRKELRLQRDGYAAALSHPAIVTALASAALGKVAILYVEWGGLGRTRTVVDWTLIQSPEDTHRISQVLSSTPVENLRGTSISGILEAAADSLDENQYDGTRRVIDLSGDGPNNDGPPVQDIRQELARRDIEVNALPLMINDPAGYFTIADLDRYYEDCVIVGKSSFVLPVRSMERFSDSLLIKLVLEIAGRAPQNTRIRRVANTDCLIGEKLRWRFENLPSDTR